MSVYNFPTINQIMVLFIIRAHDDFTCYAYPHSVNLPWILRIISGISHPLNEMIFAIFILLLCPMVSEPDTSGVWALSRFVGCSFIQQSKTLLTQVFRWESSRLSNDIVQWSLWWISVTRLATREYYYICFNSHFNKIDVFFFKFSVED